MNWPRIILDGLSMSLLFNAVAGLGFLLGRDFEGTAPSGRFDSTGTC